MFYVPLISPSLFLKNKKIKLYKNKSFLTFLDKKIEIPFKKFFHFNNSLIPIITNFNNLSISRFILLKNDFFLGDYFGFRHKVCLSGLGFKFLVFNNFLIVKLGITPNIKMFIPSSIHLIVKKKQELEIFSHGKLVLFKFIDSLIRLKKMDMYTLKGIYSYKTVFKKKVSSKLTK